VDTPNGSQDGIWMSAGGLSTDGEGSIYGASGNRAFDADAGGADFSSALFKLRETPSGLSLADWFTPYNQFSLSRADQGFGVGGAPLVLPDRKGPIPHLILTADKSGQIYLLNRDNLGHFNAVKNPDVQDFSDGGFPIHSNIVFFNNALYLAPDDGPLEQFAFNPKTGQFATSPTEVSGHLFGCTGCVDGQGSNFTISANGDENGIVWAIDYTAFGSGPAVLYAFDAANVANEIYDSTQAGERDEAAVAVKCKRKPAPTPNSTGKEPEDTVLIDPVLAAQCELMRPPNCHLQHGGGGSKLVAVTVRTNITTALAVQGR
jgi:hypothetical protein